MICTDCQQRDVCDLAGKDDPLLTGCDASHGTWAFDRLRLDRMTADRDALRAELERVRRNHMRRMAHVAWLRRDYPRSTPISFRRRGQYERFALACSRAALERKDGA